MTTITITDLAEVKPGDIVTARIEGSEYTGPVDAVARGGWFDLWFARLVLRYADGDPGPAATFVSATREVPDLPTEPGAVILDVVDRLDRRYDVGVCDRNGHWHLVSPIGSTYRPPDDIVSWTPAEVRATGERVTRD